MKGLHSYTMQPMYRTQLDAAAQVIIGNMVLAQPANLVVPVPSSNTLAGSIASLVANGLGSPLIQTPFLRKRTMGEMLAAYGSNIPTLSKSRTEVYKKTLGLWRKAGTSATFSMKEVDSSVRDCFDPFRLLGPCVCLMVLKHRVR
jgi:hypothetical protein